MPTTIPNDQDAETAIIGACLLKRESIEPALEILEPDYFYRPVHGAIFAAITNLYAHGEVIDATTVASKMREQGTFDEAVGPLLIHTMGAVPSLSPGAVYQYAKAVERAKLGRDLMRGAQDALGEVTEGTDPFEVSESLMKVLLNLGTKEIVQQALTVKEMMDDEESLSPTVIPNLIKENYRIIITARSGTGKSTFTKFIGFCAAQGIHPFTRRDITPIRTLVIDAENPIENLLEVMEPLRDTMMLRSPVYDEDRFRVWRKPGGINIRNRRDRTDLQREIAIHQPQLVIAGPAYKLGVTRRPKESWEEAAGEWTGVWDDLRTRYHFALLLEAHTSKGEDMDPQGSAYITQWPETGLAMLKEDKDDPESAVILDNFRPSRLQGLTWPDRLERDSDWLFKAVYS